MAMRVIAGEYVEKGVNHGHKVFQKIRVSPDRSQEVDVLLYYWDARDGAPFEGWWLGNKLGGTQVWAHCKSTAIIPPTNGWKVPWDGPIRRSMTVVSKTAKLEAEAVSRLEQLSVEATTVLSEAQDALLRVKAEEGAVGPEAATEAESRFPLHIKALEELRQKVDLVQERSPTGFLHGANELSGQLEALRSKLDEELTRLRDEKQRAVEDAKNQEMYEHDSQELQQMLEEAVPKTNTAEDLVEKTAITSEMVDGYGDDADLVRQALEDTEQCAKEAQTAIGEARVFLNAKLTISKRFCEKVKEEATSELGKLQKQLQEAQNKLHPLKNIRQRWDEQKEAKKLVLEVEEHLALAEVDVDAAEEAVSILRTAMPTKDGVARAQKALQIAEENISAAVLFLEGKKQSGPEALNTLTPRGTAAKLRISQLRSSLKEAIERISTDSYVEEATAKLHPVTDAMNKMEDVVSRLTDGKEMESEEMTELVHDADGAAASANTALSMARIFLQMKILEVRRFSAGPSGEATTKLQDIQRQCDDATKRLGELKGGVARRKRAALVREAEVRISSAEAAVTKVKESASILGDDAKLAKLSPEELREASEQTAVCEKEANDLLMEARKFISARQIEAKGKDSSSEVSAELMKLQARVSSASAEVSRQRKLFTSVEKRLSIQRLVVEAEKRLDAAAEKVGKAEEAAEAVRSTPDADGAESGNPTAAQEKEAELAAQEAQIAFRGVVRYIEAQGRAQGFAKDALAKLDPRISGLQERLDKAARKVKDQVEFNIVRGLLVEAQQKVSDSQVAVQKAEDAKAAVSQKGDGSAGESETPQVDAARVADFEKQSQVATAAVSGCKTFLTMKLLSTKRLSEPAARSAEEALKKMQGTLDGATKSLSEMRNAAAEMRRELTRKEVQARRDARSSAG